MNDKKMTFSNLLQKKQIVVFFIFQLHFFARFLKKVSFVENTQYYEEC
jgi:hypothetical protein